MTAIPRSVLVANRGEIAVRVIRTLKSMGIRSVAVFTDPDSGALHTRAADVSVRIGDRGAYLDAGAVVAAAVESGATALHPGYGFLSENPALAEACRDAGVVFIGPTPEAMRAMGDKINAKHLAAEAGVPVVPGFSDRSADDASLTTAAVALGLPVLLKPSAGGGGKGMRRVDDPQHLPEAIATARREAVAAFGDGTLLVEKLITSPRHIEIQVIADSRGAVVALGERECTLQRRHQKIVEETPSPVLSSQTRSEMEKAAVAVARACGYTGVGTVEFILSGDSPDRFFFMEMNTRLQVEHPVTEMVRGVDLVEWQVRVAGGEPLLWKEPPAARGHAVEARIYAEDPANGFLPSTGTIVALHEPEGEGIRVESALFAGARVGIEYDPMLAKVIAWGADRGEAVGRLREALSTTVVAGVKTNTGFLGRLLDHPDVVSGMLDTGLVERALQDLLDTAPTWRIAVAAALIRESVHLREQMVTDPWLVRDGWRLSGPVPRRTRWRVGDDEVEVAVAGDISAGAEVSCTGSPVLQARVSIDPAAGGTWAAQVELDGTSQRYAFVARGDTVWLSARGDTWEVTQTRDTVARDRARSAASGPIESPMPGTVLAVHVTSGAEVKRGDPVVTVEAMKMEHVVTAPSEGKVARVFVSEGQAVALGERLAELDSRDEA